MSVNLSSFSRYQTAGSSTIGDLVRGLLSGDGSTVGPLMDAIRDSGDDVRFRAFRGLLRKYVMGAHTANVLLESGPSVRRQERYKRRVENHLRDFRSAVLAVFAFELFDAADMTVKLFGDAERAGVRFDRVPDELVDLMDVGRTRPGEGGELEGEDATDCDKEDYCDDDSESDDGSLGESTGPVPAEVMENFAAASMDALDRLITGGGDATPPLLGHDPGAAIGVVEGDRFFPPVTFTDATVTFGEVGSRRVARAERLEVSAGDFRSSPPPSDGQDVHLYPTPIDAGDGLGHTLVGAVVSGMVDNIESVETELDPGAGVGAPVTCRGIQVGRVSRVSRGVGGAMVADLLVDWDGVRRLMEVPGFKGDGS